MLIAISIIAAVAIFLACVFGCRYSKIKRSIVKIEDAKPKPAKNGKTTSYAMKLSNELNKYIKETEETIYLYVVEK